MYTVVGSCPKCGAPIYTESFWFGILPPPIIHTCSCYPSAQIITTTGGTATIKEGEKE